MSTNSTHLYIHAFPANGNILISHQIILKSFVLSPRTITSHPHVDAQMSFLFITIFFITYYVYHNTIVGRLYKCEDHYLNSFVPGTDMAFSKLKKKKKSQIFTEHIAALKAEGSLYPKMAIAFACKCVRICHTENANLSAWESNITNHVFIPIKKNCTSLCVDDIGVPLYVHACKAKFKKKTVHFWK